MGKYALAITVVLLLSLAVAIPWFIRSLIWNKAMRYLKKGEDKKAEAIFASKQFKTLFGKFSAEWNLLRLELARNQKTQVIAHVNNILNGDYKLKQRLAVAHAAFFYFLDAEDKQMCEKLLAILKSGKDRKAIAQSELLYRVLILHESRDILSIEETLKEEDLPEQSRGLLEYLLALQYSYQGDQEKARSYLKKAREKLKGTPYSTKIKHLLENQPKS